MGSAVDTRKVKDRRQLTFNTVEDLLADIDRIVAAAQDKRLRSLGNWSAGRIFGHVAKWIQFSFDGFPFAAPFIFKLLGPLIKASVLKSGLQPGRSLPDGIMAKIGEYPDYPIDEGARLLKSQVQRIQQGEAMKHPSPVFGPMTQDEWTQLHLRHAEHHLSFLQPE